MLFVAIALVVAYVPFRPVPPIVPPEPDAIIAQRQAAQKWVDIRTEQYARPTAFDENHVHSQIHENAFMTLMEALAIQPQWPESLVVGGEPIYNGEPNLYDPAPDSIGCIVHVRRPDDDPKFVSYLENLDKVVQKAREAFAADYIRYPNEFLMHYMTSDVCNIQLARALFLSRNRSQHVEGLRCLLDSIHTDAIVQSDGTICATIYTYYYKVQFVFEIAAHIESPKVLRGSLARFGEIESWDRPPSVVLEAGWKALYHDPEVSEGIVYLSEREWNFDEFLTKMGMERPYSKTFNSSEVRKLKQDIAAYSEDLLKAADLPFPEFIEHLPSLPLVFSDDRPVRGRYMSVLNIHKEFARIRLARRSTQLVLALELFQREHGEYPKKLEELAPGCLAEVPLNPYSEKPFDYQRLDSDYRLSTTRVKIKPTYYEEGPLYSGPPFDILQSKFPIHEPEHED